MKNEYKTSIFRETSNNYAAKRNQAERSIKKVVFVLFGAMVATAAIYSVLGCIPDRMVCEFTSQNTLLYLWPPNGWIINSLDLTTYTAREKCEFIAMRSIMSAVLIPYLIYVVVSQAISSNDYYRKGEMIPFIIALALGVYTAFDPISPSYSKYKLSAISSVDMNLLKSSISIYGTYLCMLIISSRLFSYVRSMSLNKNT